MMTIKQGDQYPLRIVITCDGSPVDDSNIFNFRQIEFAFRKRKKYWKADGSGEVEYNAGVFGYPLTQEESFKMRAGKGVLDVRCQLKNNHVWGTPVKLVFNVADAISEEVLTDGV